MFEGIFSQTVSVDTRECMNGEQMPVSYLTHAQVNLNLPILRLFEGTLSREAALFENIVIVSVSVLAYLKNKKYSHAKNICINTFV